jgi:type IV pilus assembly protein PilX
MILLLLLTAISLTSLKAIKTDERLAGNLQDRHVAFQAAEAALREAEAYLDRPSLPPAVQNKVYEYGDPDNPGPLQLTTANAKEYDDALEGTSARPLYIIERMSGAEGREQSARLGDPPRWIVPYRTTALAVGGSPNTRVVLQTTFRRNER